MLAELKTIIGNIMILHSEDIVTLELRSLKLLHGDFRLVDNAKLEQITVHDELKGTLQL